MNKEILMLLLMWKGRFRNMEEQRIVEDNKVENPIAQISLTDALKIEDDYEVGEEVSEQVIFEEEFGRRQVLSIRQHQWLEFLISTEMN